jgi:hypothetical protein
LGVESWEKGEIAHSKGFAGSRNASNDREAFEALAPRRFASHPANLCDLTNLLQKPCWH